MKSNFFKIVFPAFALMLAITASLAFTPANSLADDAFDDCWYQNTGPTDCILHQIPENTCSATITDVLCKVTIFGQPTQLYLKDAQGDCNILKYRIP